MDATEYIRVFESHVGIAKRIFLSLPNKEEGMEWAEYATHIAMLTHDEQLGCLSTHVTYMAKKYKGKFVRDYKKWVGIDPRGNKAILTRHHSVHRHIALEDQNDVLTITDDTLDFNIDIQDFVENLEQKYPVFKGKLPILIEGLMEGKPMQQIADELGCSRVWVYRLRKKFKECLEHYI